MRRCTRLLVALCCALHACYGLEDEHEALLDDEFVALAANAIDNNALEPSVRLVEKRVMHFYEELSKTSQLRFCPDHLLKPCALGYGRNCTLTHDPKSGCLLCDCGHALNRAQGCAGPYGLTDLDRQLLLDGHRLCPNGQRARTVKRWYRLVDPIKNEDLCLSARQPHCGFNDPWLRMPRTQSECVHYCHDDDDLRAKGMLPALSGDSGSEEKGGKNEVKANKQ